jgi:hypothetical protein
MATITFVGATSAVTAVNASVTPTFHASTAADDLVLIYASIRNSGTGVPVLPSGWSTLLAFGNIAVFGRIFVAGDVAPAVAFTGGVANADTIVQSATFRGVSAEVLATIAYSATQLNGSAQDILFPALVLPRDRHAVLMLGWKQDDATAFGVPAGWTSINSAINVTAGDDAGQTWRYLIQTTAANTSAGTNTVTGGAAAISRAAVLALKPAATLTITPQVVYPPRNLVSVTDLTLGDAVSVYRVVSGLRTLVRAGSTAAAVDPSFVITDAELPFGAPVSYVASVNGVEYTSAAVTYTLPGGKVVLSDAVSDQAAEVTIRAFPVRDYARDNSVFTAGGRKVAVVGDLTGFTGQIELYAETTSIRDNIYLLLAVATQGVIQVRQPGGYDGIDSYVAVLGASEARFSQDGSDDRRWVTLEVVEVGAWASTLAAGAFTLQDIADAYTGLTLASLAGDYATLLAVALADWS